MGGSSLISSQHISLINSSYSSSQVEIYIYPLMMNTFWVRDLLQCYL